jgi:DNA-binding response OmpR family regulator
MEPRKMKILCVEDNPSEVRLLRENIKKYSVDEFNFLHEERLQKALQRLSEEEIDIILLDLFLPDAIGLETLAKVREADSEIPIIVLTGLFDQEMAFQGLQMGANCYFAKENLQGDALVRVMREYAAQRNRAATSNNVEAPTSFDNLF